jgi:hypothetical protein
VLASVRLEPVDADFFDQVPPLLEPPAGCFVVGEVEKQGSVEPAAGIRVRAAVGSADAVASFDHRACVEGRLSFGIGLRKRDLPEEHAEPAAMQLLDEPLRVGPPAVEREVKVGKPMWRAVRVRLVRGIVESDERRLVRPRLDHDDAGGNREGRTAFDLGQDSRL